MEEETKSEVKRLTQSRLLVSSRAGAQSQLSYSVQLSSDAVQDRDKALRIPSF